MTQDDAKNRPAQTACCPVEVSKEAVDWASNEAAGIEAAGLQPNAVDSTPYSVFRKRILQEMRGH